MLTKSDEPQVTPVLNGVLLGTPFNASTAYRFETGVRKQFYSGAEATLSTDLSRFENNAPFIRLFPSPAYTAAARLGITQPLLRGAGKRIARESYVKGRHDGRCFGYAGRAGC